MPKLITYYDLLTKVKEEKPYKAVWLAGECYVWDAKEYDYVHEDDDRLYLSVQIMAHLPSMKEFVKRPILARSMSISYDELLYRIKNGLAPKRVEFFDREYTWDGCNYSEDTDDLPASSLSLEVAVMNDDAIATRKCIYILEEHE